MLYKSVDWFVKCLKSNQEQLNSEMGFGSSLQHRVPSVLKVKLAQLVIWVSQDSEDHVDARVTRESV